MAGSVGYTAKLVIDGQLAQLLRLRVAQLNPCSYCLILHNRAAVDQGIAPERIANLPSWRESTLYSDAERAALAYCEALTIFDQASFAAAHDEVAKHFSEVAIAEKLGRASCRERVCQYVEISVVAVSFKKKKYKHNRVN